tara:strand:+ start:491 stop:1432 length:942 start_codon:yes stop_codon:yes gene_type:complete
MKVALIDDFHPKIIKTLTDWKWNILHAQKWSAHDFKNLATDIDGIFIRSRFPLNEQILEHFNNLKFIARPGSGLENIDLDYCKKNKIRVFRSPEGNRDAVAEHTIGMLLMLLNNLKKADIEVRNGIWKRSENRGYELMGKTFAIIGYGYMGEALSKRLSGFGMNVIAYDKYLSNYENSFVKEVQLNEIFLNADFVSLHTPLTIETKGMINSGFINNFKKPFYFLNTARGNAVVLKDLLRALKNRQVLGACLDVLDLESSSFEKVNFSNNASFLELSKMKNIIFSPHIAGWTYESKEKLASVILEKIKKEYLSQ